MLNPFLPSLTSLISRVRPVDRRGQVVRLGGGEGLKALAILIAAVLALLAAPGLAQQSAPPTPLSSLESLRLTLDELELSANRDDLSAAAIVDLQKQLVPLRDQLHETRAQVEPQAARIADRLKELGPPPAKDAAPEQPTISAERNQLTRQFSELDAALKLAKLSAVRADQLGEKLKERRNTLFAHRLFERSPSILDPFFWIDVVDALPAELRGIRVLTQSWWSFARDRGYARLAAAAATLAALATGALVARAWWRRRAPRSGPDGRFAKAGIGLIAIVETALPPPLGVALVLLILTAYGLVPDRIAEIGSQFTLALLAAMIGQGVGRGALAPEEPHRRLPAISDASARELAHHLAWAWRAVGVAIFLQALHHALAAPVTLSVATSGLFALTVSAMLIHLLWRVRGVAPEDGVPAPVRWVRGLAWAVAIGTAVALAIGYVGVAAFIIDRLIWAVAIVAVLYLMLVLIDALFGEVLVADSPRVRAIAANLGLTPRGLELIGTLASAVVRLLLIIVAGLLPFAMRGPFATELFGAMQGGWPGLDRFGISLGTVVSSVAVLAVGLLATRGAQRWLETNFLPRTTLDPGLRHSVSAIFGYVGFIGAVALALGEFGIDLQKIALVAGALSVGIGFGLQSIVSNFVSGLILLAERPIRVGDTIAVKGEEGYVRRISVRATEIETFERASVIIPNSELISGVVKTWTHGNTNGRIIVKIAVPYDVDADEVRDLLMGCACDHPQVLEAPVPRVFLVAFGDSGLEFELRCVVSNVDYGLIVKSDLHFAILQRLRRAGISVPYPQREIRLRDQEIRAQAVPPAASSVRRA
jgi:small-conductance mechanosensitive channel